MNIKIGVAQNKITSKMVYFANIGGIIKTWQHESGAFRWFKNNGYKYNDSGEWVKNHKGDAELKFDNSHIFFNR